MPEILTPHVNDYPNKEAYQRCKDKCPFSLPEGHLIADHPAISMLPPPIDAAEHERLKGAVLETAKEWNATPDDWASRHYNTNRDEAETKLSDAVDALVEFERAHQTNPC